MVGLASADTDVGGNIPDVNTPHWESARYCAMGAPILRASLRSPSRVELERERWRKRNEVYVDVVLRSERLTLIRVLWRSGGAEYYLEWVEGD